MSFKTKRRFDLNGHRSGHLEVLRFHGTDSHNRAVWLTICHACDTEKHLTGAAIRGTTNSNRPKTHCGCLTPLRAQSVPAPEETPQIRPSVLSQASMVLAMRRAQASISDIAEVTGLAPADIQSILTPNKTN